MTKVVRNGDTDDFEDFGYTIKNRDRINRQILPKIRKDRTSYRDSKQTDHPTN